jgi:hypothetical protein
MFCRTCKPGLSVTASAILLLALLVTVPQARADVHWRSGEVSVPSAMQPGELAAAVSELAARPGERRVVMHFDGPLQMNERAALEANGVRLLSYLGGYAYFVSLAPRVDAAKVATLSGPLSIEPIDPVNKMHPDLAGGIVRPWSVVSEGNDLVSTPRVAIYVMFHSDFDFDGGAEELIGEYGGSVQSRMNAINGVVAHISMDRVADLAADDNVMYVEPPLPQFSTLNDQNRALTQADIVNAAPYGLDGSGVTVMVYDGGTVFAHNDLAGRLTIGDSDGISDHATHVACTIGGDDNGGSLSGMAPAVDVVSYGFEVPGGLQPGFLYTDPGDLEADYTEAFTTHGADLSNNSIGSNTAVNGFPCEWEGNYGVTGALIDEVVRGSIGFPIRVVWANGNERNTSNCGQLYYSTGPPACGKNHMTIGAVNSNDDSITGFTSWGPCDDGRLKPDVSAPGCQSGGDGGVNSCSSSGGYTTKCGTSMASPTAAGISALMLQQYRLSHPSLPDFRNSLLRAIMAQTAVDLGNPGPDHQSGYGSIRAQPAADLIIEGRFAEDQVTQDEVYSFSMSVGAGEEVKVTLAWDDPAGTPLVNPNLVNDLDITITGPNQTVHLPWTLDKDNPGDPAVKNARDGVNNIEQVQISSAAPGTYRVDVTGFNIAEGPLQTFGVATSHPLTFCEISPTFDGLISVTTGTSCAEIDLTWDTASSNCEPEGDITFNIYRGQPPFFNPLDSGAVHEGVTGTTFTDFGLEPGVTYEYVVRANDSSAGEDANTVKLSAVAPGDPDTSAPVFAGIVSATTGVDCGEVLLDWEPAVETCSQPVEYEIYRAYSGFWPPVETLIGTTFTTEFVDTSVPSGTNWGYRVKAKDDLGNTDANIVQRSVMAPEFDIELLYTGFEPTDEGWSVIAPNDATTGNWEWGDPVGTSYQPEDDDTEPGVNCWITQLSSSPGNGDVDDGTTTLLSAKYDMSGMFNPTVSYSRWFTNDQGGSSGDPTDTFRVDVSNDDGNNWTSLEEVGAGTPLSWQPVSYSVPIAGTDEMRFRFSTADLGAGSLVEAGIDEFRLIDGGQACLQCTEPALSTLCTIDVERSGNDDILVDWSANPVGTRAVIYQVNGCGTSARYKLGTSEGNTFLHENAVLSTQPFSYRVTFVDECGNEVGFCGATDCP